MAKGGKRPGAGRPRTQLKARERLENILLDMRAIYGADRIKDPLDILIFFANGIDPLGLRPDDVLDPKFRAECVGKVLPFLHSKLVSVDQTLEEDRRIEIIVHDSFGKMPATIPALVLAEHPAEAPQGALQHDVTPALPPIPATQPVPVDAILADDDEED